MDDLEQQCEDALFELCDARERYPLRCADELQKCIELNNEINMTKVLLKPSVAFDGPIITEQQNMLLNTGSTIQSTSFENLDHKLRNVMNKFDNLKAVVEQIEKEKTCDMHVLLKN